MFLTSLLFLLLSPTLIFAISVPRTDNTKAHDQHDVCLSYASLISKTVTFNTPKEHDLFDYAVVTKYTTYYPNIVAHALGFSGFVLGKLDNDDMCRWQKAKSVHSILSIDLHNHRGDIYWRYSDAAYIAPLTGQAPSEDTISDITKILIDNPPAGDAYMFCTIILAWTTSLLGYILLMIMLMACIKKSDRDTHKAKDTDFDEGIELDSIETPDADGLVGTTPAATLFEDVKYVYASSEHGSIAPTNETHDDTPPTYSRREIRYESAFDTVRLS